MQHTRAAVCILLAVLTLTACGDKGTDDGQLTGDVAFSVVWERDGDAAAKDLTDCSDVEEVSAAVYGTDGQLLQTGGPWLCTEAQGLITDVPAERLVIVAVVGSDSSGNALYRGQTAQAVYLPAGGLVETGDITASLFRVTLTAPPDGDSVGPLDVQLAWAPYDGAVSYRVYIWDDNDGTPGNLLPSYPVEIVATSQPSHRPQTAFTEYNTYHWGVQAVDGAGNISGGVNTFSFFADPAYATGDVLWVNITTPQNGAIFQLGDTVDFNATVDDQFENRLSPDELAVIDWSSDINETLSEALAFSISSLLGGSHTITLYAENVEGSYGDDTISIVINRPPTAAFTIFPDDNGEYLPGTYIITEYTGSDPDGETIAGDRLTWQLWDLNSDAGPFEVQSAPGATILEWTGEPFTVGNYQITLIVRDYQGGTSEVTRDISIVEEVLY